MAQFIDALGMTVILSPRHLRLGANVDPNGQLTFNGICVARIWLYIALMERSAKSATLGKMALGLMVLDTDGYPISFGQAAGRYFGKILSLLTCYAGFISVFFNEKKQGWHDSLANTVVVEINT